MIESRSSHLFLAKNIFYGGDMHSFRIYSVWSWLLGVNTILCGCYSDKMEATSSVSTFIKHSTPVLSPTGDTWESKDVFNPTAWTDGKTVFLLYRAEDHSVDERKGISRIGIATSNDGLHFHR